MDVKMTGMTGTFTEQDRQRARVAESFYESQMHGIGIRCEFEGDTDTSWFRNKYADPAVLDEILVKFEQFVEILTEFIGRPTHHAHPAGWPETDKPLNTVTLDAEYVQLYRDTLTSTQAYASVAKEKGFDAPESKVALESASGVWRALHDLTRVRAYMAAVINTTLP